MSENKVDVVIELHAKDPSPATVESHKQEYERVSKTVLEFIEYNQGDVIAEVWLHKTIKACILEANLKDLQGLAQVKKVSRAKDLEEDEEFITPINEILYREDSLFADEEDYNRLSKDIESDNEG